MRGLRAFAVRISPECRHTQLTFSTLWMWATHRATLGGQFAPFPLKLILRAVEPTLAKEVSGYQS